MRVCTAAEAQLRVCLGLGRVRNDKGMIWWPYRKNHYSALRHPSHGNLPVLGEFELRIHRR
jgi:hypothetical protein